MDLHGDHFYRHVTLSHVTFLDQSQSCILEKALEMRKLQNPVPIQALINWLMSFHSSQVRCKWHKIQEAEISHKKLPEIFSKYVFKSVF